MGSDTICFAGSERNPEKAERKRCLTPFIALRLLNPIYIKNIFLLGFVILFCSSCVYENEEQLRNHFLENFTVFEELKKMHSAIKQSRRKLRPIYKAINRNVPDESKNPIEIEPYDRNALTLMMNEESKRLAIE